MAELDIIYEDLTEDQKQICDCIGIEAYTKLVLMVDGDDIYIPKVAAVSRSSRNASIINDFNGYNYKYLSRKYGLTVRTIRSIVADSTAEKRNTPLKGQITWDDLN